MISSMTGFGDARGAKQSRKYVVELRSINSRFLDFQIRLPNKLNALESEVKQLLQKTLKRGKVMVFITIEKASNLDTIYIDEQKVAFYTSSLKKMAKKLKLSGDLTLKDVLSFPDIFQSNEKELDVKKVWTELKPILSKALVSLSLSRSKEGKMIFADVLGRLKLIQTSLNFVEKHAEDFPIRYRKRLEKQFEKISEGLGLEQDRVLKEVALMAERADVTEEIVRLNSHIELFRKTLKQGKDIGKRLDFISQEMNREANTIASKCLDAAIAEKVVQIKSEIEKIKEQIQNVE